jgi:hypothetical protein
MRITVSPILLKDTHLAITRINIPVIFFCLLVFCSFPFYSYQHRFKRQIKSHTIAIRQIRVTDK